MSGGNHRGGGERGVRGRLTVKRRRETCEEGERHDGKTGAFRGGCGLKEEREGAAGRISDARQKPGAAAERHKSSAAFFCPVLSV